MGCTKAARSKHNAFPESEKVERARGHWFKKRSLRVADATRKWLEITLRQSLFPIDLVHIVSFPKGILL